MVIGMKQETIRKRLDFWNKTLDQLMDAYTALISGGVKSYTIDNRQLTRFDLPALKKEIEDAEKKIDALTNELNGQRPRKAFGIVPMDF